MCVPAENKEVSEPLERELWVVMSQDVGGYRNWQTDLGSSVSTRWLTELSLLRERFQHLQHFCEHSSHNETI